MDYATQYPEFEISGHDGVRNISNIVLPVAAVGLAVVWGLVLVGATTPEAAVLATVVAMVLSVAFVKFLGSLGRGVVRLHPKGLLIETAAGKQVYAWAHIADAEIEGFTFGRGRALRSQGGAIVRITLSRSLRLALLPRRFGTDIAGIPTVFFRTIRLPIQDPEGFVAAIRDALRTQTADRGTSMPHDGPRRRG